ncbi:glycosyltransferase family 4 protein [Georgenia ruanii]|uniref:D-inositol 3-phosphate glycosyltransferase n=1 Tax=Georgenia ruanii TaxID=348442 RepID=A0A7J9USC4_9MICO|nr:glycosyltransferase family 4 protein [Georgenia ruanii]MPV87422.1 glycosyltransferase [Georgenia ruanii]
MSRLRVVHVSDCYPPRVGGIETQVHDLAVRQARAGHDVHVLTATGAAAAGVGHPGGSGHGAAAEPGGPTVHRLATPLTFGVPVHPLEGLLLRRALRELRPDIVHVHAGVVSPFAHAGARAARRLGLPLAVTWHCMLDGVVPLYRAGAALAGWRRAAVALSAVSAVAGERVARVLAVDPADVLVVPNGLDVAAWAPPAGPDDDGAGPAAQPAGGSSVPGVSLPPAGPLRVVATQRLAPRKRPVPLVRVIAAAHERLGRDAAGRPRLHLTLVGSGPAERAVRAEVARRGLGDVVEVAGRLPRAALAGRYRGEHVFLAPARLEAFGIAALEARAAGLAVVAGRGTGVSEFVRDGVDGLLTPDRADGLDDGAADAALAAALVRLAREDGLLAGLLAHNRRVAPAADWADVLAAADALYARARARARR